MLATSASVRPPFHAMRTDARACRPVASISGRTPQQAAAARAIQPHIAGDDLDMVEHATVDTVEPAPGAGRAVLDEGAHVVPVGHQPLDEVGAYESAGPGDEDERHAAPPALSRRHARRAGGDRVNAVVVDGGLISGAAPASGLASSSLALRDAASRRLLRVRRLRMRMLGVGVRGACTEVSSIPPSGRGATAPLRWRCAASSTGCGSRHCWHRAFPGCR